MLFHSAASNPSGTSSRRWSRTWPTSIRWVAIGHGSLPGSYSASWGEELFRICQRPFPRVTPGEVHRAHHDTASGADRRRREVLRPLLYTPSIQDSAQEDVRIGGLPAERNEPHVLAIMAYESSSELRRGWRSSHTDCVRSNHHRQKRRSEAKSAQSNPAATTPHTLRRREVLDQRHPTSEGKWGSTKAITRKLTMCAERR